MSDTGRFANVTDEALEGVDGPEKLAAVIEAMLDDLVAAGDEWENGTLPRYLEALAAFIPSKFEHPQKLPVALTWRHLAHALVAATGYE